MAWLGRQDLEEREERTLGRFASRSRRSGGRRKSEKPDPMRTDFQRDRDRILHCASFRRLQHKTQVLAAFEGDHFRSRLTHSLEVAQMARSAALALSLNHDLAEAVALAHDLGHPPFGHVGEEGLNELMAAHGGFRHNAQGVRIVDYLENRHGDGYGLNLVASVRHSLLKGAIPPGYPLSPDLTPRPAIPLEGQLVDLCDRIAYLCHDLDDGMRAGAFALADAQQLSLWQRAEASVSDRAPRRVISEMIRLLIMDLVATCAEKLSAAAPPARLRPSDEMTVATQDVQTFLRERFYRARLVLDKMERGRAKIELVFQRLVANPAQLPPAARSRIESDGLERTVCDYVAGMTDRFLVRQSEAG